MTSNFSKGHVRIVTVTLYGQTVNQVETNDD